MQSEPVLIVGAGIAGLTTALALHKLGLPVEIYERTSALLELGAGLQLASNAARVLIDLGLEAEMERVAVEATGKAIRLWNTGQSWPLFDLGAQSVPRYGAPYWLVHRGDFFGVLLRRVEALGIPVHAGAECVGYRVETDRAVLRLANGQERAGRAIVAADGVHSAVRAQLAGAGKADFCGIMAWRGIAQATDLPEHLRQSVGVNWVGPGRHIITYPLRGGEVVNFVGVVERDDWRAEGWTIQGDRDECHRDFDGWHDDVHAIIANLDQPFKWALLKREPLARCADDRVVLIGDACHPTLPFMAQGACMAIEDAMVVARCLAAHEDPAAAFDVFEQMRLERTGKVVHASTAQATRFHNPALADAEGAAAYVAREWAPALVEARYDWLFRYDAIHEPLPPLRGGASIA